MADLEFQSIFIRTSFCWQMIGRIKPKHLHPIIPDRLITFTNRNEKFPHIWYRGKDAIMHMRRCLLSIPRISKGSYLSSARHKAPLRVINLIQMKIHMHSPLWAKDEYGITCRIIHVSAINDESTALASDRCTDFTKYINSRVRMTGGTSRPRPMPKTLMII